jgi:hypothetical protein
MFGRMTVMPTVQVGADADLQVAITTPLRAADQPEIVRWIEFPALDGRCWQLLTSLLRFTRASHLLMNGYVQPRRYFFRPLATFMNVSMLHRRGMVRCIHSKSFVTGLVCLRFRQLSIDLVSLRHTCLQLGRCHSIQQIARAISMWLWQASCNL